MKSFLPIIFLFFFANAFAQIDSGLYKYRGQGSRLYKLSYPNDTSLFLNGYGKWASISGGSGTFENWSATQSGSPVLAPTVSANTKGIAINDSAVASGFESNAIGVNTLASGYKSISIGNGKTDAFVGGNYLWATGDYSLIIGTSGKVQSLGSIGIGDGVTDVCTYNDKTNFLGGGNNTLVGTSTYNDTGSYSTSLGWSASNYGRSGLALGDGAVAWRGCNNISLGSNSGAGSQTGVHNRQIFISGVDVVTDNNVSHFDSTTLINGHNLVSFARGAYYQGYNNATTASGSDSDLWVLGNGKVYGNVNAAHNALSVTRNGVVAIGKAISIGGTVGTNGQVLTSDGINTSWSAAPSGTESIPFSFNSTAWSDNNFYYPVGLSQGGSSADPTDTSTGSLEYALLIRQNGTLENLYLYNGSSPQGTDSIQIIVWRNKSATPLIVTLTAGVATFENTADTVSVSKGDFITLKLHFIRNNGFGKTLTGNLEYRKN